MDDIREIEFTIPWFLGPTKLWVRGNGDLAELTQRAVAVVGSRACTQYGEHVAANLGLHLSTRSWTVVSGGAYGIDSAAHRGVLAANGDTVAVLACGLDRPYPASNASLFNRIAEYGLVVSAYEPGTPPSRDRFLARNRLIAAMCQGLVVVEAAARSGSMHAATCALELGRPVMAVPGPVTSAMSAGTHRLIRDGAQLVRDADDVTEVLASRVEAF
jgi:DNA processing protein